MPVSPGAEGPRPKRSWVLYTTVPLLLLAPTLLLLVAGPAPDTPFDAVGDLAVLELYTRLAAQGQQLLGPHSRLHFHHPGPAYFYASVPLYELSGESYGGLKLAAAFINALAMVAMLAVVRREAGLGGYLAAALALSLFVLSRGPGWLSSTWNPNVAVLPFGAAFVALAALGAGAAWALPVAVAAGSFAVQTHVGCAPVLAAVGLAAAALYALAPLRRWARLLPRAPLRRWPSFAAAGLLALVLWAPPAVEQMSPGGGNLGRLLDFALSNQDRHPLGEASGVVSEQAAGFLLVGLGASPSVVAAGLLAAALAAGLVGGAFVARRRRDGFAVVLSLVCLLGLAVALLTAARMAGPILPYLLEWVPMLGVASLAAVVSGLRHRLRPPASKWAARLGVTLLLVLAFVSLRASWRALAAPPLAPPGESLQAGRLAARVEAALRARGVRRALVEVVRPVNRTLAVGLLLALDKKKLDLAVEPFGPYHFGGRFAPHGTEDARVVVSWEDPSLLDRPGGERIAQDGVVSVYLLPRP